jgi:hypothetical protein
VGNTKGCFEGAITYFCLRARRYGAQVRKRWSHTRYQFVWLNLLVKWWGPPKNRGCLRRSHPPQTSHRSARMCFNVLPVLVCHRTGLSNHPRPPALAALAAMLPHLSHLRNSPRASPGSSESQGSSPSRSITQFFRRRSRSNGLNREFSPKSTSSQDSSIGSIVDDISRRLDSLSLGNSGLYRLNSNSARHSTFYFVHFSSSLWVVTWSSHESSPCRHM